MKARFLKLVRAIPLMLMAVLVFYVDQTQINTIDIFCLASCILLYAVILLCQGVFDKMSVQASYLLLYSLFLVFGGLLAAPSHGIVHVITYAIFWTILSVMAMTYMWQDKKVIVGIIIAHTITTYLHLIACINMTDIIIAHQSPWVWFLQSKIALETWYLSLNSFSDLSEVSWLICSPNELTYVDWFRNGTWNLGSSIYKCGSNMLRLPGGQTMDLVRENLHSSNELFQHGSQATDSFSRLCIDGSNACRVGVTCMGSVTALHIAQQLPIKGPGSLYFKLGSAGLGAGIVISQLPPNPPGV